MGKLVKKGTRAKKERKTEEGRATKKTGIDAKEQAGWETSSVSERNKVKKGKNRKKGTRDFNQSADDQGKNSEPGYQNRGRKLIRKDKET